MYSKTTKKINITVKPFYLEDQSDPEDNHYVWAYQVTINNNGDNNIKAVKAKIISKALFQNGMPVNEVK